MSSIEHSQTGQCPQLAVTCHSEAALTLLKALASSSRVYGCTGCMTATAAPARAPVWLRASGSMMSQRRALFRPVAAGEPNFNCERRVLPCNPVGQRLRPPEADWPASGGPCRTQPTSGPAAAGSPARASCVSEPAATTARTAVAA